MTVDGLAGARDLGVVPGSRSAGELNAITDVAGLRVGHTTLIEGSEEPDPAMNPLFAAAMNATEEAILNSLLAARTISGFQGHVSHAVSLDRVRPLCGARGVLTPDH